MEQTQEVSLEPQVQQQAELQANVSAQEVSNTSNTTEATPVGVAKTTTHSTIISSMTWNKAKDGTPVVCAILKDSSLNLHTKTTVRSYLTALAGPVGAIEFVHQHLEAGDISILSNAKITWERTSYPPNIPHTRSDGELIMVDTEDVVDHIVKVDLQPISELLLDKKLEEMGDTNISPLREKILMKNFGVAL